MDFRQKINKIERQVKYLACNLSSGGVSSHFDLEASSIGTYTHAQIDTHIDNDSIHREIDDASISTTLLWSSNKIDTELDKKVDKVAGKELSTNDYTNGDKTKVDFISITQAVDLDAIETRVNELDAAVVLKGTWDASTGNFPASTDSGESWIVTVAGTVDGVDFQVDDRVIATTDNASTTTYAGNWHKADYTDRVNSVAGKTGSVTLEAADITSGVFAVARIPDLAASKITSGTFADGRISSSSVTQHEGDINHDALNNFVANEHIDWTVDQGTTNIHANNVEIPNASETVTGLITNAAQTLHGNKTFEESGAANLITLKTDHATTYSALVIEGNTASNNMIFLQGSSAMAGTIFGLPRATAAQFYVNNGAIAMGTVQAHDFTLGTNNTERMRISSAGVVSLSTAVNNAIMYANSSGDITHDSDFTWDGVDELGLPINTTIYSGIREMIGAYGPGINQHTIIIGSQSMNPASVTGYANAIIGHLNGPNMVDPFYTFVVGAQNLSNVTFNLKGYVNAFGFGNLKNLTSNFNFAYGYLCGNGITSGTNNHIMGSNIADDGNFSNSVLLGNDTVKDTFRSPSTLAANYVIAMGGASCLQGRGNVSNTVAIGGYFCGQNNSGTANADLNQSILIGDYQGRTLQGNYHLAIGMLSTEALIGGQFQQKWVKIGGSVIVGTRASGTVEAGEIRYNSSTNKHQGYDGTTWNDMY